MATKLQPGLMNEVTFRTELRPGDIGFVIFMHGAYYRQRYHYGIEFETYVAEGLLEFYRQYDPSRDGVWICEHQQKIIGFLLLMHRQEGAQLRYFILDPAYRGFGLGNELLRRAVAFLKEHGYHRAYLWTTHELVEAAHLYKKFGFHLTEEKASTSFGKPLVEQRYDLRL